MYTMSEDFWLKIIVENILKHRLKEDIYGGESF